MLSSDPGISALTLEQKHNQNTVIFYTRPPQNNQPRAAPEHWSAFRPDKLPGTKDT